MSVLSPEARNQAGPETDLPTPDHIELESVPGVENSIIDRMSAREKGGSGRQNRPFAYDGSKSFSRGLQNRAFHTAKSAVFQTAAKQSVTCNLTTSGSDAVEDSRAG